MRLNNNKYTSLICVVYRIKILITTTYIDRFIRGMCNEYTRVPQGSYPVS